MTRVQISIDDKVIRAAVTLVLRRLPGVSVSQATCDGLEGVAEAALDPPDVVVTAPPPLKPPGPVVESYRISVPGVKVVLLRLSRLDADLYESAGADAVIDADDGAEGVAEAVGRLAGVSGSPWPPADIGAASTFRRR